MKILLDVPNEGLANYLAKYGHEVSTVTQKGVIPDDKMISYALENDCVLILEDKEASREAERRGLKMIKISKEFIAKAVIRELENSFS